MEERAGELKDRDAQDGKLQPLADPDAPKASKPAEALTPIPAKKASPEKKLSYKEQRKLYAFPIDIRTLEARQEELETSSGDPDFCASDQKEVAQTREKLSTIKEKIETLMDRWAELDERA